MRNICGAALAFILGAALSHPSGINDKEDIEGRLGDDFAFDVAARSNEALLANVDAIDTSLTAVLAGDVAILAFTIDKLRELEAVEKWIALGLLCSAAVGCATGYLIGVPWRRLGNGDGIRPSQFIPDFARQYDVATTNAIAQLVNAAEVNVTVRLWKRILVVFALTMLLAGVALVTAARLNGKVV